MDEPSAHILVVDDHREIRDLLGRYLAKQGLRATVADSAASARRILQANAIDLVVLDIMMPGEDGLSFAGTCARRRAMPVILLTAMAEETDRVIGLEMGADDYVTKPFNPRELLARIRAVLRRTWALPPQRGRSAHERIRFDRWTLEVGRRELVGRGRRGAAAQHRRVPAARARSSIARGMVLSRDQLLDLTRGRDAEPFDRSIDNQVSRLRKQDRARPEAGRRSSRRIGAAATA